jgi:hypothetical protein
MIKCSRNPEQYEAQYRPITALKMWLLLTELASIPNSQWREVPGIAP